MASICVRPGNSNALESAISSPHCSGEPGKKGNEKGPWRSSLCDERGKARKITRSKGARIECKMYW